MWSLISILCLRMTDFSAPGGVGDKQWGNSPGKVVSMNKGLFGLLGALVLGLVAVGNASAAVSIDWDTMAQDLVTQAGPAIAAGMVVFGVILLVRYGKKIFSVFSR